MPIPRTAEQPGRAGAANARPANAETSVRISRADLPLHCPLPGTALWASHPRVFIPIDEAADGRGRCPYCGTEFILEDAG